MSLKPKPKTALPQTPGCQLLVFKGSGFSVFKGSGLSVLEAWLPAPDWTLTCDVTSV